MLKSLTAALVLLAIAAVPASAATAPRYVAPQPNPIVEALPYILVGALIGGVAGAAIGGSVGTGSALAIGTHSGLWFGVAAGGVAGAGIYAVTPRYQQ